MEELLQFLIGAFRLSIGPGVKHRGGVLSDAKRLTHFGGEAAHESGISVMNERFRKSYTFEYMFQIKFGDSFGCYRFVAGYEDDCLGTVVVCDCEY